MGYVRVFNRAFQINKGREYHKIFFETKLNEDLNFIKSQNNPLSSMIILNRLRSFIGKTAKTRKGMTVNQIFMSFITSQSGNFDSTSAQQKFLQRNLVNYLLEFQD